MRGRAQLHRIAAVVSSAGKIIAGMWHRLPGVRTAWATSERWLHRLAQVASSAAKIFAAVLVCILLVLDLHRGIVRVKPFEVPKSFEEAGYTGAALAERVREKLTDIESKVVAWKARGGREDATIRIKDDEPLGEVKVPGAGFSIDELGGLFLTALGRPPIQVTGRVSSTHAATIATIKAAKCPLRIKKVPTPQGCDDACVDALVTWMAEAFYSETKPCSLELYYYSECESDARRCAQADSVFADAARSCARADPVFAYNIWGIFEQQRRNFHAAVDHFQQALMADREGRPRVAALIYNNWGNVLTQVQDCPGAIAKYHASISSDPNVPWAYSNLGVALEHMKDKTGAATMYDKAICLGAHDLASPKWYIRATVNRAHLLYDEGKFSEAARLLQRASEKVPCDSEKVPRDTTILRHLAYSLGQAGKNDDALAAYERVIDLDPHAIDAYRAAADLLRSCHRLRAAHEELGRALPFAEQDQKAKANLRCELADLEKQLREEPPLSSQVGRCDSGTDGYLNREQTWTATEPCDSPKSCVQLVADPQQPGTFYCTGTQSQDSVALSLAVTTDAGATWRITPSSAIVEKPDATIQRMAFAATHGALFALSSSGAISRSLDHGAIWQQVGGPSLSSFQPLDFAFAPGNGGAIYILLSAKVSCPRGGFNATSCARYRLFTSRNWGRRWLARGSWLLADPTKDNPAGQLWADPFAASTLYAGVTAGANSSSLMKSLDGGTTWRHLDVNPPVVTAVFDPAARGIMYIAVAGDCRQVLKSTDAGEHWSAANGGGLPHDTDVTALAFDGATLYAGTADGDIFATVDGARVWHEVAPGLPGAAKPILSLAADGHGTVYAGLKEGGLYALTVRKP
jgi:tetratricopeptide (TPR) repeat protein/photosystem II stability/assembly factor-like uncharacterized protein